MQPLPTELLAESIYNKALAAGLSHVTIESEICHRVNYNTIGRSVITSGSMTCKGTSEQEAAFRSTLEETEGKHMHIDRMKFAAGDDCPQITLQATADGSERVFEWSRDDPKTYLIQSWASWSDPCQELMASNQAMLESHPEWEGKVEIIVVSMERNRTTPDTRIREKGWTRMSSYWSGEEVFESAISNELSFRYVPCSMLIKRGKIVWTGHSKERKFEADLIHLLTNEELPPDEQRAIASSILSAEDREEKLQFIEKLFADFVVANPGIESPMFMYIESTVKRANAMSSKGRALSGGSYSQEFIETVKNALKPLEAMFQPFELSVSVKPPTAEGSGNADPTH